MTVLESEPMSRHTTFRTGGPARWFCPVSCISEMIQVMNFAKEKGKPLYVIGRGSNLLVSDRGIDGVVMEIADGFKKITISENIDRNEPDTIDSDQPDQSNQSVQLDQTDRPDQSVRSDLADRNINSAGEYGYIYAEAGAKLSAVAAAARDAGLAGLAFAAGIPGTLGGGISMNAGAYGGEMKDCVEYVDVLFMDGSDESGTGAGAKTDNTQADSTQAVSARADSTKAESAQMENAQADNTQADSTKLDSTKLDSTKLDSTKLDSTKLDNTKLDNTKLDNTKATTDGTYRRKRLSAKDMHFAYRHSRCQEEKILILGAMLKLPKGDPEKIAEDMRELNRRRREKQPLEYPSAGSTFKRPEGHFAGKLIQDAGLRGYAVGDAMVSEKHCGFVINRGNATSDEIYRLIRHIEEEVEAKFGVILETEVRLLGDFLS